MANALSPTAANIISSLGIRGATVGENLPGFVPVLDDNGKISVKLIPDDAAKLAVAPISDVAFVDPYTSEKDAEKRTGSITAPFVSVMEAASRFVPSGYAKAAGCMAFVLFPGRYTDTLVDFPSSNGFSPLSVYMIGVGECVFTSTNVSITGAFTYSGSEVRSPELFLQNVVLNGVLTVSGVPNVTCLGKTFINDLELGGTGSRLYISADSRVSSTNVTKISFLSEADNVGNTSEVDGDTVEGALNTLGRRKIRVAKVSYGSTGITVDSSVEDVSAKPDSAGYEVYDISERDRVFAQGINDILRNGKFESITAGTIQANSISTTSLTANEINVNSFKMGGYRIQIDAYGYLVVLDEDGTAPEPPDNVVLLRDLSNGATYVLGVSDGRMFLQIDSMANGDGSSGNAGYLDYLTVYDPESGVEYRLYVDNGRLMISILDSSSSS